VFDHRETQANPHCRKVPPTLTLERGGLSIRGRVPPKASFRRMLTPEGKGGSKKVKSKKAKGKKTRKVRGRKAGQRLSFFFYFSLFTFSFFGGGSWRRKAKSRSCTFSGFRKG
jgi:hypothetical protein